MATRKTIRNAFLSEIEDATSGTTLSDGSTFSTDNVVFSDPEDDVSYPKVTYDHFEFPVSYNDGSAPAPKQFFSTVDGDAENKEVYADYEGIRFDVTIEGSELDKEPLFESIRGRFAQFDTWRPKTDLHSHVIKIDVRGTNSADRTNTENTTRLDVFSVDVEFYRAVDKTGEPIRAADTITDVGIDGTGDGEVYTTN